MSSRQLRKLQKQKELESSNEVDAGSEDETSEPEVRSKPKPSLFAALGGGDEDEDDEQDLEEEQAQPAPKVDLDAVPEQGAMKKNKKKKKKKKAKAAVDTPEPADDDDQDEIDKAIKELNLTVRKDGSTETESSAQASNRRIDELLSINTHHLKALNEMRHLFGREIIESATAEEEEAAREARRQRGAQQNVDLETFIKSFSAGARKLPEISLRRNVFIQGREHWPLATTGGLTMKVIAKEQASTEYAYLHEGQYDSVQELFFSLVQVGDPMRLVYLLKEIPYHVSTLLQVSSVAKQDQNMALAAELCERALFTFGRVATSAFRQDIEHGRARLDFRRPENRQFWLAGYHYLRSLIRKGTYRTALEWAKLMFALDRTDPYGMRHYIQFLAIRAYESRWYVDFMEELENTSDNRDTNYLRQSVVLAKLQLNDVDGAREALEAGIMRVPWLYCALFQELNLDAPPSVWGISSDAPSRSFWVKLYIYQMKDLWNNPQAIALLQAVAQKMDRVDTASLPADDPPADLGATRLVYLEGQTSLMAAAPRHLLDSQPNYEFDPLPPPKGENIFTAHGAQLPFLTDKDRQSQPASEIEVRMQNMLARQHARAAAVGGAAGGAGAPGEGGGDAEAMDEELAAILAEDDEELARDLEAHQNRPGMLDRLMQLLGGGGLPDGSAEAARLLNDDDSDDDEGEGDDGRVEGLPGAWPEEQERDDHNGRTS